MSAIEEAERLARRMAALRDPAMRITYLRYLAAELEVERLTDVIAIVLARCAGREPPFTELMLGLSVALADPMMEERRGQLAACAADRGLDEVARLFRARPEEPAEGREEAPAGARAQSGERPLTLGERKSLARSHDRGLITRLLRDPHPEVIRVALGNPHLTEEDVIRLAARRPISAQILRTIFLSPRWVIRARVRYALIRNPRCPLELALQLAPLLDAREAAEVAASPELGELLREACVRRTIH